MTNVLLGFLAGLLVSVGIGGLLVWRWFRYLERPENAGPFVASFIHGLGQGGRRGLYLRDSYGRQTFVTFPELQASLRHFLDNPGGNTIEAAQENGPYNA